MEEAQTTLSSKSQPERDSEYPTAPPNRNELNTHPSPLPAPPFPFIFLPFLFFTLAHEQLRPTHRPPPTNKSGNFHRCIEAVRSLSGAVRTIGTVGKVTRKLVARLRDLSSSRRCHCTRTSTVTTLIWTTSGKITERNRMRCKACAAVAVASRKRIDMSVSHSCYVRRTWIQDDDPGTVASIDRALFITAAR